MRNEHVSSRPKDIAAKVRSLVGDNREQEYRVGNKTVTLASQNILGIRMTTDVIIRDSIPLSSDGDQTKKNLFPYRGIRVIKTFGRTDMVEIIGTKTRKKDGTLGEWQKPITPPSDNFTITPNEQTTWKKFVDSYKDPTEQDLLQYADLLKLIVDPTTEKLDKYGRTPQEREQERDVVRQFGKKTNDLIAQSDAPQTPYVEKELPDGSIVCIGIIHTRKLKTNTSDNWVNIYPSVNSEIKQITEYTIRKEDGRLGKKCGRETNFSPVLAGEGLKFIFLLDSLD